MEAEYLKAEGEGRMKSQEESERWGRRENEEQRGTARGVVEGRRKSRVERCKVEREENEGARSGGTG